MKDVPQSKHQIMEKDNMIKDVMQKVVSTVTFAVMEQVVLVLKILYQLRKKEGQDDQEKKFHE